MHLFTKLEWEAVINDCQTADDDLKLSTDSEIDNEWNAQITDHHQPEQRV